MILTINDPKVFQAIAEGKKTFEGRREKEELLKLKPGDFIIFFLEGSLDFVIAQVSEVRRFPSIRKMVEELWQQLIPFAFSPEAALEIYKRYYSPEDPAVAIGIRVLHVERVRDPRIIRKIMGVSIPPEQLRKEKFLPEALASYTDRRII